MVTLAFVGGAAPAAQADAQPAILKAYGLDWIERVREEAWPQPKAQRPVICLLDTGVAITPDTPADNPEGPIVARLSVEDPLPGSAGSSGSNQADLGLPQGGSFAHLHGTRMAAIIAAPRNAYGTVGVFPQGQIVSVRVTSGADVFTAPEQLVLGVRVCRRWASSNGRTIASVVMAESGVEERPQDVSKWEAAASLTRAAGGIFVAAAGNTPDATLVGPLSARDVLAVGAGDDGGELCPFARPDGGGHMTGPGCSTQSPGWYPGSSSAAATVGALAGVLATRSPDETPADRQRSLLEASSEQGVLRGIGIDKRFTGLVAPLPGPASPLPQMTVTKEPDATTGDALVRTVLWRPSLAVRWKGRRLHYKRTNRPRSGVIRLVTSSGAEPWTLRAPSGSLRLGKKPRSVTFWAESTGHAPWRSLSRRAKLR